MAKISLEQVKELRKRTGVGINYVKEALENSNGNIEEAILYLRKKGIAKAAKRSGNETNHGYIASYIHGEGQIGVLVEIATETDFAARNDDLKAFAFNIALHIAASDPQYVEIENIPEELIKKEESVFIKELEGKPKNIAESILKGKLQKYYEETVLMEQRYLKDDTKSVKDYLNDTVAKIGEKVSISRFSRIQIGGLATTNIK
ncbi:elongation factor Ts [Candidatus Dojkabacteria bacterium]|nr:elongation factor Ts [Candidatus Dojkabacteria bacterium]